MKIVIYIFGLGLLLVPGYSYSQYLRETHWIHWTGQADFYDPNGNLMKMPTFDGAFHDPDYFSVPSKRVWLESVPDTVWLENVRFQPARMEGIIKPEGFPEIRNIRKFKTGDKNGVIIDITAFLPDSLNPIQLLQFDVCYRLGESPAKPQEIFFRMKARHSVLSTGEWYKLKVNRNAVYRIDYQLLKSMGINPSGIDPRTIKIFGNGGRMLSQENTAEINEDLMENSIWVMGEADGKFDQHDYILFYGQSPHFLGFKKDEAGLTLHYDNHLYTDDHYYFLTYSGSPGKRVGSVADLGHTFPIINEHDELIRHEEDLVNILQSGREWYGEKFDLLTSYQFDFRFPGIINGSELWIRSSVMGQSYEESSFTVSVNEWILGEQAILPVPESTYALKGRDHTAEFSINTGILNDPENITLNYRYNKTGTGRSAGYLNYFLIWYKKVLGFDGTCRLVRSVSSLENEHSTFQVQTTSNGIRIWNITDPLNPYQQEFSIENGSATFGVETTYLGEYVLFEDGNTEEPEFAGRVENQDLHGMPVPDYLIITHPDFMAPAQKLADFRSSQNNYRIAVVTVDEIYNEFSSGAQDVTAIRNFIRYLFNQGPEDSRLRFVLLFGKGSYDYKSRSQPDYNYVPIYQSRNSLHPVFSYSSDDYYTFLDEEEGAWVENSPGDHDMDLNIGRIPVKNPGEAWDVVNKIIRYETDPQTMGPWRQRIGFVADDGDGTDGTIHTRDADRLATLVDTSYTDFSIEKIFIDAYPQVQFPNRQTAPEVNRAITDLLNKGILILNYTGHGSELQWAAEAIFNLNIIADLNHWNKIPLYVTATCEFGRHDNPRLISGAEYALFNDRGGAIALVTTARPVFSSTNFILNQAFYEHVFEREQGRFFSIGEIFRRTKNSSLNGVVNRNFSLLGDPAMKLAYPENSIQLTGLNNEPITGLADTIKALQKINLEGVIINFEGQVMRDFNGLATVSVFDKPVVKQTLGYQDPVFSYKEFSNVLYRGEVRVINGEFTAEFISPKNLNYAVGPGRINLYAFEENTTRDAGGSSAGISIGGTSGESRPDQTPPVIDVFLNDSSFQSGDWVGADPVLKIYFYDRSGMNSTSYGIEQGITALLDGLDQIGLSSYYVAGPDDFRLGSVNYKLGNLSEGYHNLEVIARDVYNNTSRKTIEFYVMDHQILTIRNYINFPNPFTEETVISFEHNRSGEDLEVNWDLFSITGDLIKQNRVTITNSEYKVTLPAWDGTDVNGKKIQSGIYLSRVLVRSLNDGAKNSSYRKLILIY